MRGTLKMPPCVSREADVVSEGTVVSIHITATVTPMVSVNVVSAIADQIRGAWKRPEGLFTDLRWSLRL